ncbi:sulfotransferase 6B1-like [Saccoglossus kowalevskii]|uniref:Sulfotransferase 4A1-like n=1 Tax=Saccoglossus kowalevskii TaxID=10224 RepID=A0ABM0MGA6_SACKO|nr:PREDICTED: sulfotransferase 4A1-like [Saccoglossus kowalevskii]
MAVPNIPTTGPIILHDTEPEIDGILYPKFMQEKVLRRIKDIEVREDDVWLLSYPKTGTHWMKGVLYQIFNHDTPEGSGDKEAMSPDDFVPFLEFPDFKKPGEYSDY